MLERTLKHFRLRKQAAKWKVVEVWPQIVGESIAKISRPFKVIQGTLYVGASSSSWANELDMRKQEILALIKQHLGETGIRDIRFQSTSWTRIEHEPEAAKAAKLSPADMKKIHALSEKIENEAVRQAFEKLLIKDALKK